MSATIPRELKVLVERVVRPLPIPLARQKRMRTEFLQHLQTIYAEELTRDDVPAAALNRTRQRFGDPVELTTELRGTVRRWQRWEWGREMSYVQLATESLSSFALRLLKHYAVLVGLAAFCGILAMTCRHWLGYPPMTLARVQGTLAIVFFLAIWFSGFLMFGLHLGDELERPTRRWPRILLFFIGLVATWPLGLTIMLFVAGGSWSDVSVLLVNLVGGGIFSLICGTMFGVFHHRDTNYRREWADLDIDAA